MRGQAPPARGEDPRSHGGEEEEEEEEEEERKSGNGNNDSFKLFYLIIYFKSFSFLLLFYPEKNRETIYTVSYTHLTLPTKA